MGEQEIMEANYAVAPGAYLQEWAEESDLPQQAIADRLGRSRKFVNDLIHGRAKIDHALSLELGRVTPIPTEAWRRYEERFRADQARLRDEQQLAQHFHEIPPETATYLRAKGFTRADKRSPGRLVADFLDFHGFGTWAAYLDHVERVSEGDFALAARKEGQQAEVHPNALHTWLRLGELQQAFEQGRAFRFDEERLRGALPDIKARTSTPDPEMLADVAELLAGAGVVFMIVEPPRKFPLFGMTRWIDRRVPVIQQTGRRQADGFITLTLFHEIGHILNDPRGEFHLEFKTEKQRNSSAEKEANKFARAQLFGDAGIKAFEGLQSDHEIRAKSRELGISPGVAVCEMRRVRYLRHDRGHRLCVNLGSTE